MDADDGGGGGGDEEFEPTMDVAGGESTLAVTEQEGDNCADEVAALEDGGGMPIEQLKRIAQSGAMVRMPWATTLFVASTLCVHVVGSAAAAHVCAMPANGAPPSCAFLAPVSEGWGEWRPVSGLAGVAAFTTAVMGVAHASERGALVLFVGFALHAAAALESHVHLWFEVNRAVTANSGCAIAPRSGVFAAFASVLP